MSPKNKAITAKSPTSVSSNRLQLYFSSSTIQAQTFWCWSLQFQASAETADAWAEDFPRFSPHAALLPAVASPFQLPAERPVWRCYAMLCTLIWFLLVSCFPQPTQMHAARSSPGSRGKERSRQQGATQARKKGLNSLQAKSFFHPEEDQEVTCSPSGIINTDPAHEHQ